MCKYLEEQEKKKKTLVLFTYTTTPWISLILGFLHDPNGIDLHIEMKKKEKSMHSKTLDLRAK